MDGDPHGEMDRATVQKLIDLVQWQKIQDLLAELIQLNLELRSSQGPSLGRVSQVTPRCEDITKSLPPAENPQISCPEAAFRSWTGRKPYPFSCTHKLNYLCLGIGTANQTLAVIVAGPLLLGKRHSEKTYRRFCEDKNVDPEVFLDRIRELKVFSHTGLDTLQKFLNEMARYLVTLIQEHHQLEQRLLGISLKTENTQNISPTKS